MHDGRGDLRRLVVDLENGRLTPTRPKDFVVLLQEATPLRGGPLRAADDTNLSVYFGPVRNDGGRIRGNAILSTQPLRDMHTIELPRERQRRIALAAMIEVSGQRLFVASAHLENRVNWLKGGLLSDTARGRQADALLRELPPAGPGILGGDMNTWLGRREPAWRLFAMRFDDTPREPDTPTFRDRLVLDHLFFDLPAGWHASHRVLDDAYGSDHKPVVGMVF